MPATRVDPIMGSILSQHTPDSPSVGYLIPHFIPAAQDQYQWVNRVDAILGDHSIMGRFIYGNKFGGAFNDPQDALWNVGINDGGNTTEAMTWAITDTWTVSPNVLVTGRFRLPQEPLCPDAASVLDFLVGSRLGHPERSGLSGSELRCRRPRRDPNLGPLRRQRHPLVGDQHRREVDPGKSRHRDRRTLLQAPQCEPQ